MMIQPAYREKQVFGQVLRWLRAAFSGGKGMATSDNHGRSKYEIWVQHDFL